MRTLSDTFTPTTNQIVKLTNAYEIVENWKFLLSVMEELNDPRRARAGYNAETWFNMLCRVACLGKHGLVCILTSKNGKPLGFGCGFSAEDFDMNRCFYVWQAYSNGKCHTALSEMLGYCESYARTLGHSKVKTATPRLNGAADRLFTETLGFDREFYTYTKTL